VKLQGAKRGVLTRATLVRAFRGLSRTDEYDGSWWEHSSLRAPRPTSNYRATLGKLRGHPNVAHLPTGSLEKVPGARDNSPGYGHNGEWGDYLQPSPSLSPSGFFNGCSSQTKRQWVVKGNLRGAWICLRYGRSTVVK
jgi:hypothetical protein